MKDSVEKKDIASKKTKSNSARKKHSQVVKGSKLTYLVDLEIAVHI